MKKTYIDAVLAGDTNVAQSFALYDELMKVFKHFVDTGRKYKKGKVIAGDITKLVSWFNTFYSYSKAGSIGILCDKLTGGRAYYPVLFKKICFFCITEYNFGDADFLAKFGIKPNITFKIILELIKEDKKLSRTFVEKVLKKWTISTISSDGKVVLYPISIFNALQGFVEYGEKGIPCFLMQGEWYCFDDRYTELLSDEFKKIIKSDKEKVQQLKDKFSRNATGNDENLFNDSFFFQNQMLLLRINH